MTNRSHTLSPSAPLVDRPDDDARALIARATNTARAVIAAVEPDQLDLATPCDGFDVRGLVSHLVGVLDRIVVIGRGGDVFAVPAWVDGLTYDEWLDRWDAMPAELQQAWDDDALMTTPVQLPWTVLEGAPALAIYDNEITVHTWDLAQATGQSPDWDPDVLAVSLLAIHDQLPTAARTEFWAEFAASLPPGVPFAPPFGDAVPVPADAPVVDQLVAWNGRRP